MIVTAELEDEVCRFRELLTGLALFDEEFSVHVLATASSLSRSEYVLLNLQRALTIARRHGRSEVADWLQSALDSSADVEFGVLTGCKEPAAALM